VFPASVFDPVSARIAEDLGYEIGMLAGSVASMTVLAAPDLIVLNQAELAEQAHRICRAGDLPLVVDADHGFGNALNVRRTVEELEYAGVAAVTIEDTRLPGSFGSPTAAELTTIAEGVGKMRAALEARGDASLLIVGRTGAARVTDIGDAVERVRAYQDAGVDMLMLVGIRTRGELDVIAKIVRLPIMLGGAGAEVMDKDYLAQCGVRICLTGHQPFLAAMQAVHDTLKALRDGIAPSSLANVADAKLLDRVTRNDAYRDYIRRYLGE
jgi:carboxyvinyl-carboxyphosphonate phosphorylmutase